MTALCHCDDCQRSSGSAFSINVGVRASDLQVEGELQTYETIGTDTHERRQRRFCPKCGSQVLTVVAETPGLVVLKAGTLDDRSWLSPRTEVWRQSAQSWTQRRQARARLGRGVPSAIARPVNGLLNRLIGRPESDTAGVRE